MTNKKDIDNCKTLVNGHQWKLLKSLATQMVGCLVWNEKKGKFEADLKLAINPEEYSILVRVAK